jgi:hypothetical protein
MLDMFDLMINALKTLFNQAGNRIDVLVDPTAINWRILNALVIRGYLRQTNKGKSTVVTQAGAAWLAREARR